MIDINERCIKQVYGRSGIDSFRGHRCTRKAVNGVLCKQHLNKSLRNKKRKQDVDKMIAADKESGL